MKSSIAALFALPLNTSAMLSDWRLAAAPLADNFCSQLTAQFFGDAHAVCSDCHIQLVLDRSSKLKLTGGATCFNQGSVPVIDVSSESEPISLLDLFRDGLSVFDPFWTTLKFSVPEHDGSISLDVGMIVLSREPSFDIIGAQGSISASDGGRTQCSYKDQYVQCGEDFCFDPLSMKELKCTNNEERLSANGISDQTSSTI